MRSVAAAVLAEATRIEVQARAQYRHASYAGAYWAMLDLQSSAAYRLVAGDEESYARARVFADLVGVLADGSSGVTVFKELGDGLLIKADGFREIVELACVLDAVNVFWRTQVANDSLFPSLEGRVAITHGECIRIGEDYLGSPIDLVARLSGYKSSRDNCIAVVDPTVVALSRARTEAEYPFLRFEESVPLPSSLIKPGERAMRVTEISIDRAAFAKFDDYFVATRELIEAAFGR